LNDFGAGSVAADAALITPRLRPRPIFNWCTPAKTRLFPPRMSPRMPFFFWAALTVTGLAAAAPNPRPIDPVRLMAVGDSITEGGDYFTCYRPRLRDQLQAAGYAVEFVGTRTSATASGPLAHEGYSGKNTEWLLANVPAHFRAHPADIVLLHSGHNHTVEEQPVPGIVAATGQLIAAFRAANPRVTVLLAQVIPAGKLPKYAYLPELNAALAQLAARLDTPAQRVILVDQATGFDWRTDTVADHVHPNAAGAAKMAARWLAALVPVLPKPAP
jgi:lysophospholipase L1-like esterase